ncbi:MAG: hypothetical protein IKO90_10530 [Bacteroidales bacterium]|nr:hypothetical protein [Bacteroidales bacterium]
MKKFKTFGKSEHFLLRQWERGFSDSFIEKIVWKIPFLKKGKNAYIISKKTLKSCGEQKPQKELVLVLRGSMGITMYFIDDLYEFFSKNHKDTHFQIV